MLTKVHGCCSYEEHAVAIAVFRSEGKFGERFCGVCGGPLQLGPERCPHSSLVINGRSLCELCRNSDDGSRAHRVSEEQIEAFLEAPISDKDLTAAQEVSDDTALVEEN